MVTRATAMRRTSHVFVTPVVPAAAVGRLTSFAMPYDLVRSVTEELRWDPRIDAERIAVTADGRPINLRGTVHSYSANGNAEKIAREIRGVASVKNVLEVRLTIGNYRTDEGLERL